MPDPCVSSSNCVGLALTGSPGALVASLTISTEVGNRLECRTTGAYARDRISSLTYGPGVQDYESFRVKQRGAGANMSVDVGLASTDMYGYLPDSSTNPRITSYEYNGTQINATVTASDATNPRIDIVTLRAPVLPSLTPTVVVTAGTPGGGSTLDNRTGAAATPSGDILLADLLIPALSTTVVTANIRDRRQVPAMVAPWTFNSVDVVSFEPHPAMVACDSQNSVWSHTNHDTLQAAAAMYLPRHITATAILFRYRQGGAAMTGNFNLGVFDISGRPMATIGATAFAGAANAVTTVTAAIAPTFFPVGLYYVWAGLDSNVGTCSVQGLQYINDNGPNCKGVMLGAGSGSVAVPTTLLAFTDRFATTTGAAGDLAVPTISLQA